MGGGASAVLFAIDAAGLADHIAFVTDSQLSGLCLKGLTVAEVAPEAAVGGPLAKLCDGDRILIDALAGSLDLDVAGGGVGAQARAPQRLSYRCSGLSRHLPPRRAAHVQGRRPHRPES